MTAAEAVRILAGVPAGPCLLCGKRSRIRAIFLPNDSALYGARPGKDRVLRYDVCRRCRRRPDLLELAEGALLGRVRGIS